MERTPVKRTIDRLYRRQCTATYGDGEAPEELLLLDIQQIIAPSYRVAQRLLPCRNVPRPAGQQLQSMCQTYQERPWGKEFDARRCQFDGEREPIQPNADLRDGAGGGRSHLEVRPGLLRSLLEKSHCRVP